MFHSARDEKGKAQESIGSWAFLQHKGLLLLVSHPVPASCLHWVEVQPKGLAGKEPACECSLFDGILIQQLLINKHVDFRSVDDWDVLASSCFAAVGCEIPTSAGHHQVGKIWHRTLSCGFS